MALLRFTFAALALCIALPAGATPHFQAPTCGEPDQASVPLQRTPPAFPHQAKLLCLEGSVHLAFGVDQAGRVENIKLLSSDPPSVFDRAALRAVETWLFQPACSNGEHRLSGRTGLLP